MKPDLERAVGLALGAQAEYLMMASEAEDKQAKQVFDSMAEDVDRHVKVLRSRQEYLQKWGPQLQQQQLGAQQGGQAQMAQGGMQQQQGMMAQQPMQQGMMTQQPMQQGMMAQQPMQQQMAQGGAQAGEPAGSSGAGATASGSKG